VSRPLTALKAALTVAAALIAVTAGSRQLLFFAAVITVALVALTVRDLLAPVRVAADDEAVTVVTGYAGHRRIPWGDVERIRVDERRRLGRLTAYLEIDTGDMVHLFSRYELDTPCEEVAEMLLPYTQMAQ
jgi:Bacterial PH domain